MDLSGSWGSLETMRLGGTIAAAGEANGVAVDSLQATVRLDRGTLLIDTLRARSSVGTAAARGRVGLAGAAIGGPLEGSLEARISDLAPLGPLVGMEPLGIDSGRVVLALEGTRTRPAVHAEVQAAELTHGPYRIRALSATVAASLDSGLALAQGTGQVRLEGLSSGKQGVSRLQLEGSYADRRGTLLAEADLDAQRHARVAARLTREGGGGQVSLDTLELTAPEDRWSLAHPVAVAYEGSSRLHVNDFVFASEKSRHHGERDGRSRGRAENARSARHRAARLGDGAARSAGAGRRCNRRDGARADPPLHPAWPAVSGSTFRLGKSRWPEPPSWWTGGRPPAWVWSSPSTSPGATACGSWPGLPCSSRSRRGTPQRAWCVARPAGK